MIRAMRDNFSSREKLFFLRYLSAEGYLPDRYEGILWSESDSDSAVSWIVDRSFNDSHQAEQRKRLRQVLRLTICSALAWLALVGLAILHSPRWSRARHLRFQKTALVRFLPSVECFVMRIGNAR